MFTGHWSKVDLNFREVKLIIEGEGVACRYRECPISQQHSTEIPALFWTITYEKHCKLGHLGRAVGKQSLKGTRLLKIMYNPRAHKHKDNQNVVFSYNGISFSYKKEYNLHMLQHR